MYDSFDDYLEYLKRNKDKFPANVYEFAIDINRHILESPHSFHDSWLTSITIKENRNKEQPFEPTPSIEIVLLGQMHDRDIILTHEGIESYSINGHKKPYNWGDTFQGDISCHEIRINKDGQITHEIEFVSESRIIIACRKFKCVEQKH